LGTVGTDSGNTLSIIGGAKGKRDRAKLGPQPKTRRIVGQHMCLASVRKITMTRFVSKRLVFDSLRVVSSA